LVPQYVRITNVALLLTRWLQKHGIMHA